ncbi:MAG: PAS domain S-box protein [Sedimentisphaerales bacterium]|nr:PAS domain S-box protein [Sedimentisphaerales bacterium]
MVNKRKIKLIISVLITVLIVNVILYYTSSVRFEDAERYLLGRDTNSLGNDSVLNSVKIAFGVLLNTITIGSICLVLYYHGKRKSRASLVILSQHLQQIIQDGKYSPIKDMSVAYDVAELCEKINIILGSIEDNTLKSKIITDKISIGLAFLDETGKTVWVNPAGKAILGFDKGRNCNTECDLFWESSMYFPLKEVITSGVNGQGDVYNEKADRWFQVNISPFNNIDNNRSGYVLSFHDITERYRAQQGLNHIGKIISSSDLLAVVRNVLEPDDMPVSYVSGNILNILGYNSNVILSGSINFDSLIHPDDLQLVKDENKGYMYHTRQEKWVHNPYRMLKNDGSTIWIEDCTTCSRSAEGVPLTLRSVLKDVTEDVHARQHRQQAWLVAKVGYWSYDAKSQLYHVSAEALQVLGVNSHNNRLTFDAMFVNIVPEDKDTLLTMIADSISNRFETYKFEFRILLDEREHFIMMNSSNEYDQDGNLVGKYGIVQDISSMKEMELELESERVKYYSVYKYSGDAIVIFDEDRNVIDCNNKTLELFAADRIDDLKNKRFRDLSSGEQGNKIIGSEEIRILFDSVRDKSVCVFDWFCQNCKGAIFVAQISLTRFFLGNKMFYQAVIRDMSLARKRSEDLEKSRSIAVDALTCADEKIMELQKQLNEANNRAKEAEISNNIKSEFLTCMSHEIRTPLNAIIGFADVLNMEDIPDDMKRYVDQIRISGKHLLGVINDVLDLSKIEAGKVSVSIDKFTLNDLLSNVTTIMEGQARSKGLYFNIERKEPLPELITSDMQQLKQCLINLVGNAIKFTNTGGVTIEVTRSVKDKTVEMLCFTVSDTGVGISQEQLMSIFEPFVQSSRLSNTSLEGSGLGLSITKKLAKLIGATVTASSQINKGSIFVLTVPVDITSVRNVSRTNIKPISDQLTV